MCEASKMGTSVSKRPKKILRVIIMGLPNTGKTVLLYRLKLGETVTTIPTMYVNREHVEHDKVQFDLIELPHRFTFYNGELNLNKYQHRVFPLLNKDVYKADAIIYCISMHAEDTQDQLTNKCKWGGMGPDDVGCNHTLKENIQYLLSHEKLKRKIFAVICTKSDLPDANKMSKDSIMEECDINEYCPFDLNYLKTSIEDGNTYIDTLHVPDEIMIIIIDYLQNLQRVKVFEANCNDQVSCLKPLSWINENIRF